MRRPVIAVIGAGDASPDHLRDARRLGRLLAEAGWIVLTGGRDAGVMAAAAAGAKEVPGSLTVGILPDASAAISPHIDVAIQTDLGNARNNLNVLTSECVVACGVEGAGTASEVALALKAGRPVILVRASAAAVRFYEEIGASLLYEAATAEEALALLRGSVRIPSAPPFGGG